MVFSRREFTLITDHQPLMSIFSPQKEVPATTAARMQRWALSLRGYQYKIEFQGTGDHANADRLTRLPLYDRNNKQEDGCLLDLFTLNQIESTPVTAEMLRNSRLTVEEDLSMVSATAENGGQTAPPEPSAMDSQPATIPTSSTDTSVPVENQAVMPGKGERYPTRTIGIGVGDRANVRPVPSDGPKIIQAPKVPSSRTGQERPTATTPRIATHPSRRGPVGGMRGESPPHPRSTQGGRRRQDHGQRPNHPTPRQAAEAQGLRTQSPPAPKGRVSPPPGGAEPPQTAHQGGTARYPPLPPPPPPRSRPHAPQPREGQAEAHVGPPAKGAPRDRREADSRAGPDPPGRGRASGPRTRRAQPRGAPERGPPTSRSICARRRPPPGRQTAAHHSTFREVRHDEPQPCLPDTPQTERRGPDPPRPATPHGHHCCPHPDRQSQHGQGVGRNRALRSAPMTTPPTPAHR
uniref:basic salivary proline-rich protein 2-like n=1 Tax=Solea senegalensis TaxID=28829 RepID=UPI001CD8B1FD|nr:basic salivary proline-rich protein 2-like [Solea senegalensis]